MIPLARWVARLSWPCIAFLLLGCRTGGDGPKSAANAWQKENPVWRGIHLGVRNDAQAAALIEKLPTLATMGVNILVVEVGYSFEYRSHPELRTPTFLSSTNARNLAHSARKVGIRVIPQINCLGHQSWAKNTGPLLTHYPEFDETPGLYPNNEGIYCRSWCPQHPDVTRVVFSLIDEVADAFEATAFHVGMDEVFLIGSDACPRCRGEAPGKLFAKAVNDLHAHIVGKRKMQMLMWGDRLLDARTLGYSKWEAADNSTHSALNRIPRDVIICDWHYGKQDQYPSIPFLLNKGFRVWPSGWQPLEATVAFSNFARSQKDPRLLGFLNTTWSKVKIQDLDQWPPLIEVLKDWKQ